MRPGFLLALSSVVAAQTAPYTFTLPNGLKVILFEDHSLPLIRGELSLALPPPSQDPEAWLRPLGLRMLAQGGSGNRSAAAFASATDAIGLGISPEQHADALLWTFSTRSQDQEAALGFLADEITRPAFDPLALEPMRLEAWSELTESSALDRARLQFLRSLSLIPEPTERELASVTPLQLAQWHQRLFRPDRATLALWGDLDPGQARQLALLTFGAWTAQTVPPPRPGSGKAETGPFLAALPGESPLVLLGLVEDGQDAPQRRYLKRWVLTQLTSGGLATEPGNAIILRADGPLGTPVETLRQRLATALDALPGSFGASDLEALRAQAVAEQGLLRLHPGDLLTEATTPQTAPKDLAEAKEILDRWCAPANRRVLASGDPGSLQGLQTTTPKR